MASKLVCWRCGEPLQKVERPFPRLAKCHACEADLHVCRMCVHFKPGLSGRCDHETAEPAREVDLANFCHYLKLKPNAYNGEEHDRAIQAMDKFRSLFGDEEQDGSAKPGRHDRDDLDSLKALFRDSTNQE